MQLLFLFLHDLLALLQERRVLLGVVIVHNLRVDYCFGHLLHSKRTEKACLDSHLVGNVDDLLADVLQVDHLPERVLGLELGDLVDVLAGDPAHGLGLIVHGAALDAGGLQ